MLCLPFSLNQGGIQSVGPAVLGPLVKSPRVSPHPRTDKFPWEERRCLAKSTFPLIRIDISELLGGLSLGLWTLSMTSRWQWASFLYRFGIACGFPSNCVARCVPYMSSNPVQLWQAFHFSLSSIHSFSETWHCLRPRVQSLCSSWENISLVPHRVMLATLRYRSWV